MDPRFSACFISSWVSKSESAATPAAAASSAGLAPRIAPTLSVASSASDFTAGRDASVTATLWVGITSTVKSTCLRRSTVSKIATIRSPSPPFSAGMRSL